MTKKINLFANLKSDFASGLVVFLVALPDAAVPRPA